MASLARLITSTSQDTLPLFGVWSNYSNTPGWSVYDSDLGMVAGGRADTGAEMYSTWTGNNYSDGNISSNSFTSYWVGGTPLQYHCGNGLVNLPTSGGYIPHVGVNPSTTSSIWQYFGTVIEQEGIRPRYDVYVVNATVRMYNRGATMYNETFNWQSSTYSTTGGGTTTYGMISYNERARKLCIITSDGSSYWYHEWYHPGVSLGKDYVVGNLRKFMSEAKAGTNGASYKRNTLTWNQDSAYSSYGESQYHNRIIMGDNGRVGLVRFVPNYQTSHRYFDPVANEGSATASGAISSVSVTTSYGQEQGAQYGMRHNHTWDNNWFVCYSPYYYYGSGVNAHYVSAKDPQYGYYYQYGSSTNGFTIVPFGERQFIHRYNEANADGNAGLTFGFAEPEGAFRTGFNNTGSATSNGSSLNPHFSSGIIDTYYTSTLYPALIPMRSWRIR